MTGAFHGAISLPGLGPINGLGVYSGLLGSGAVPGVSPQVGSGGLLGQGASGLVGLVLGQVASWILDGTSAALRLAARVIGTTTEPHLAAAWFVHGYWRVAGLGALLTVPFLFAAGLQALIRSDPGLLFRAAFVDLPVSALAVAVATPLVTLLLIATDQMSALVGNAGSAGGARFLARVARAVGTAGAVSGSDFLAVFLGLLTLGAAIALMVELLIRDAAVYVVVLMLPLAFAALVWPARRIWAVRLTELLIALILSKFVIVTVLSLAGAALGSDSAGPSVLLPAMALVMLSTFAPWALLRILPFTELAAGAASSLHGGLPRSPIDPDRLAGRLHDAQGGPRIPASLADAGGGGSPHHEYRRRALAIAGGAARDPSDRSAPGLTNPTGPPDPVAVATAAPARGPDPGAVAAGGPPSAAQPFTASTDGSADVGVAAPATAPVMRDTSCARRDHSGAWVLGSPGTGEDRSADE